MHLLGSSPADGVGAGRQRTRQSKPGRIGRRSVPWPGGSRHTGSDLNGLVPAGLAVIALLVFASVSMAQDVAESEVDSEYARGVSAFAEGRYEEAAALWQAEAERGLVEAQFNLGVLYSEGRGLPQSRQAAMTWFLRAAQQGHVEAQYNLGHLMLSLEDDPDRVREGIQWWRRSAEGGFVPAQYNYARALYHGIGIEQNRRSAKAWFEHAALGGNDHAARFIAEHQDEFGPARVVPNAKRQGDGADASLPEEAEEEPVISIGNEADYVRVKAGVTHAHTRFNALSPIITGIEPDSLLRVVEVKGDWLRVEVPGGLPGWVPRSRLPGEGDSLELNAETRVIADPTESGAHNDFGILRPGIRLPLLETDGEWARVRLPESVSGWVQAGRVTPEPASSLESAARGHPTGATGTEMASIEPVAMPVATIESVAAEETGIPPAIGTMEGASGSDAGVVAKDTEDTTPEMTGHEAGGVADAEAVAAGAGIRDNTDSPDTGGVQLPEDADSIAGLIVLPDPEPAPVQVAATSGPVDGTRADTKPVMDPAANDDISPLEDIGETEPRVIASGSVGGAELWSASRYRLSAGMLEVLTAPMAGSPRITTLDRESLVEIVTLQEGFAKVTVPGGLPLWVAENDIRREGEQVVVSGRRVRGWSDAAGEGRAMGLLPDGSILRVLTEQEGWIRVMAPEWLAAWVAVAALEPPRDISDVDRAWRQQADSRLQSYLDETAATRSGEAAPDPGNAGQNEGAAAAAEGFRVGGNRR